MKWPIVLLLCPVLANADPASPTKFLMNEPATLLDIGMVRLDNLTREFGRRVGVYWTTASGTKEAFRADINSYYDAKDDKIHVSFFAMDSVATDAQMKEGCEEAMEQISIWIWKSLPTLFLHEGFENTVEAAEPYKAIADLFELRCYISAAHDSSIGRFWARRSLRDPELKIGPWDLRSDQKVPAPSQPEPFLTEDCYTRKAGRVEWVPYPTSPAPGPARPDQQ